MNNDINIRPEYLDEFIGQEENIKNLKIFIEASINRKEILDHCLFYGPPGTGKTTLARIIANETGGNIKEISGATILRSGDLAAILSRLNSGDVLFIDEIHRIDKTAEELLYSAMEDYQINVVIGNDTQARNIKVDLPPFVLVGATTKIGYLSAPLRDRFGIVMKFENYDIKSLKKIALRTSNIFNIKLDIDAANYIASISRGVPRITNKIIRRIRDFLSVDEIDKCDLNTTKNYVHKIGIDDDGFTKEDKEYIRVLKDKFHGGPVGLNLLSETLNDEPNNIEQVIESYLIQKGMIIRTPKGRMLVNKE